MSQSGVRSRKRAQLSTCLYRDLTRYALAAGAAGVSAFALTMPAQAEIIHTKVDRTIASGQSYSIDLNRDGIIDFSIHNISNRCTRTFSYCPELEIVAYPANGNEIEYGAHDFYAAALRPRAVIGSRAPMNNAEEFMADEFRSFGVFYYFGSWLGVKDRFLGLSFQINGETHYGWARLTVRSPEKYRLTAFLSDFAYETEPNTPIQAGATGKDESAANDPREGGQKLDTTLGALAVGATSAK
jgi:hypothetical protein